MSERNGYEHGVPCWVTNIQPDPAAAADFYGALFGWEYLEGGYYTARLKDRDVAAVAPLPDPPPAPDWITDVWVDSADETAEKARSAGGTVLAESFDGPSGRMAVIADPGGGVLSVTERHEAGGAQLVNEPGAWAMSRLDTPDVEGAREFYGAVFGWTTEDLDMGEMKATMFRLPGYVGGEPQQPVSREVVAVMVAAEPGAPARWSVDFWVGDVDAAVATATERGGAAVAGPFDTPVGRTAVLADPAGVTFTVTKIAGT